MLKPNRSLYCMLAVSMFSLLLFTPATAGQSTKTKPKHTKLWLQSTTWPQICPVSGEKIASLSDAVGSSVYDGKKYYFCCSMCKPLFDKDPAKYAAAAAKGKYLTSM